MGQPMGQNACSVAQGQAALDEQLSALFCEMDRNEDLHRRLVVMLEAEHPDKCAGSVPCLEAACPSGSGPTLEMALQRIFSRLVELGDRTMKLIERVERQVGQYKLLP